MQTLDPNRNKLTKAEHERVFWEKVIPGHVEHNDPNLPPIALPQDNPVAYLLAGQPGAGKSYCRLALLRNIDPKAMPIQVGSDIFRIHHPQYTSLQREDDQTADFYTDIDARQWVNEAISYAVNKRYSVLIDSTLSRPNVAKSWLKVFRDRQYSRQVLCLAVPKALSQLSNLLRYHLICQQQGGHGRICLVDAHDSAYDGVVNTAKFIDAEKAADVTEIRRRHGRTCYANRLMKYTDAWEDEPPRMPGVIQVERECWCTQEAQWFYESLSQLRGQMSATWTAELDRIAQLASGLKPCPAS